MIKEGHQKYPKNPRQNANVISLLTFWWTRNIFRLGYRKELEETDLYATLTQDKASYLGEIIRRTWEAEVESCAKKNQSKKKDDFKPQLVKVLMLCFGKPYILTGLATAVVELFCRICQPLLLATLLRYYEKDKKEWSNEVYYCAAGIIVLPILDTFIVHYAMYHIMHIGLKIKIACTALIYQKILKLSNSVFDNETSVGQMVNFVSSDITKLESYLLHLHYIWISPIQMVIILYFISPVVGWAGVIGIAVFILFIPFQLFLAKKTTPQTIKMAERSDSRLTLMSQLVAGLQVIKMYVWEIPFAHLVEKARKREMRTIKKLTILMQMAITFDSYVPRLCIFVTILSYVLFGNFINAEKVYLITAYFGVLRISMIYRFAMGLHQLAQILVCCRRLQTFMMHNEIVKKVEEPCPTAKSSFALRMTDVTAKWQDDAREHTLRKVNLTVLPGSLVVIVGPVGSGKSSLLHAILGELPLASGSMESHGRINYVSQQPWIFSSSIKQNVLFDQPMDKSRYDRAIKICQMESDISSFSHSDRTIVGERGINLSGGQRIRVNLARVIYKDADIYLLDDPLSAMDSEVSRRIIDECICGYLKEKTRILVTHQLQYLPLADQIIVMNNGVIEQKGTFSELQAMGLDFMQLLKTIDAEDEEVQKRKPEMAQRQISAREVDDADSINSQVETRETMAKGHISRRVFFAYFKASKRPIMITLMILVFLLNMFICGGNDYFVAFWVNIESNSWTEADNQTMEFHWQGPLSRDATIYLYSAIIVIIVLLSQFQTLVYSSVCTRSSINLHSDMFRSIMRATMYFYCTNPAGRILNRFARDINIVDLMLSMSMYEVIIIALVAIPVVVMVVAITPWLAIPTVVCVFILIYCRMIYSCTSRAVKRLDGITRSPIFDHLGASLQGLTTIRAFNAEKILLADLCRHQDLNSSACLLFLATSRAFGFYVDIICNFYIGVMIIAFTVFDNLAVVGNIGLILTQLMLLTNRLQWGIRQSAEVENQLTSIERILEYIDLEEEPMIDSNPETKPPDDWPTKSLVEFKDVKLKYNRQGAYILRNISFTVLPQEKIGIVGRTGAGKSSLINALFRLAYVEGEIIIDGISTGAIALHDFRSKISIIPQEPFLFTGSLRRNLDPFDQYSDAVLWQALEDVELKDTISDLSAGLNTKVSDEGSNFSVGQKQLLCLARIIIKNNRIIILDEATANIDPYTDSLIQKTVRTKFVNCTVFTIAHRLNTIMDSDRIFVMDGGRLVEIDHPHVLLQQKGRFYNMVQQTGAAMAENLTDIAAKSFYEKNRPPSR